jgi:hypothetical protein
LKDASADMQFVDFMRLWLRMKKKEVTARTCQGYEMMIGAQIKKFFTPRKILLSDLGPEHIEDFYDAMYDEGRRCHPTSAM